MSKTTDTPSVQREQLDFNVIEDKILKFWRETDAFKKSVELRPLENSYIFYDGPPFATGTPHYGHLLASTIKDVIPRYKTMRGFRVERVWGWDCHGIPIEHMIEKELELEGGKIGIENYGIDKFNAACRAAILRFDSDWQKIIERLGRWVDFENSYKTMDNTFMESVWWGFKQLYDKGLAYQGRKVILYCPRCETPLSNFEIAMDNSYQDVTDASVYAAFKIRNYENRYLVAWTTTPWTLLGNVALAVSKDEQYVLVEHQEKEYWVSKKLSQTVFANMEGFSIVDEVLGKDLAGIEYEPLYTFDEVYKNYTCKVYSAEFVTMEEGTGIVHIAPMYGEDDYQLAQEEDLPVVNVLDLQGKALSHIEPVKGKFYKKIADWVLSDLESRGLLFNQVALTHSYPYCYRCSTPLYYNAIPAWFINVQELKPKLIEHNEKIAWYPSYLKHGRFKKGIENAPDWNISRSRYWGTPMPIWIGEKTGAIKVIGSVEELRSAAVDPSLVDDLTDLHREFVDTIEVWVDEDRTEKGKRIPEVFDCWVESGSMPFASIHYPFENKEKFENSYPAQFISEYIAQTRAWFYTLHVQSVGLFDSPAFLNSVTTGTILAEDGSKMSKSKKNFPDPWNIIEKYGVDALRLYLMASPVMKGENLNFSESEVNEIRKKVFGVWWNMLMFYDLYCQTTPSLSLPTVSESTHVLDRWLLSYLAVLQKEVTTSMDQYDVVRSSRLMMDAVQEISTWYLRLSRTRLRESEESVQIFGFALLHLSVLMAPFAPYFTEMTYQRLTNDNAQSIHHLDWPSDESSQQIDESLMKDMIKVREIVQLAHAARKDAGIRIRQPLSLLEYSSETTLPDELHALISQETNVEMIVFVKTEKSSGVKLDTTLTPELLQKGEAREIIRQVQDLRKAAGVAFDQKVKVQLPSWPEHYELEIKEKTLAVELIKGDEPRLLEA